MGSRENVLLSEQKAAQQSMIFRLHSSAPFCPAVCQLSHGYMSAVGDGFPVRFACQRSHSDRQIGQHKYREGKGEQELSVGAAIDLFPFRDGGEESQRKHGAAQIDKTLGDGEQNGHNVHSVDHAQHSEGQINQNADPGENRRRRNVHQHIKTGEVPLETALDHLAAVPVQHL